MQINLNRNTLMIGCAVQLLIVGLIIYIFLPLISLLLKILVAVVLIAAAAYFGYSSPGISPGSNRGMR